MAKKKKRSTIPNKGGRPPIHATPEDFEAAANGYFLECELREAAPTVTGLALAVGFSSIQSLDETSKRPGFLEPVKRAKLRVENSYEQCLRGDKSPVGSIFALKNFGWRDKQEVEHSGGVSIYERIRAAKTREEGGA